jgi:tetratricopeptide (TPR) repeat protein
MVGRNPAAAQSIFSTGSPVPARLGQETPPTGPLHGASRQPFVAEVFDDLRARGVAVIQGPSGSGTSRAAAAVARGWEGGFGWSRAGLWRGFYDLVRPAWAGPAPAPLLREAAEAAVDCLLAELRAHRRLLVIDAVDGALRPAPSPADPLDPELAVLVAALEAGELADSGGAVLFAGRRAPANLHVPVRPIPRLSPEEAASLADRPAETLPESLLRRPGVLALLRGLPGLRADALGESPFDDLVAAACAVLEPGEREVLLCVAVVDHPLPAWGVGEAAGIERPLVEAALERLEGLGLVSHREHGWRCPRAIGTAARRVVPATLKGVLPWALAQRAAGFWMRQGADPHMRWTTADDAFAARLGVRCAVAGGGGRMAAQGLLYGGTAEQLERLGALRPLRDDLTLALSVPDDDLPPEDRARAAYALARVARSLSDPAGARTALSQAARALEEAPPDPDLEAAVHRDLGRELLLGGNPENGLKHLERARLITGGSARGLDVELLLGAAHLRLGRLEAAAEAFERGRATAVQQGVEAGELACREGLAAVDFKRGRLREAEATLIELLRRSPDGGEGAAHRRANLIRVRLARGDVPGAREVLEGGMPEAGAVRPRTHARLLVLRGRLRWLAGELDAAEADIDAARGDVASVGDREGEAERVAVQAGILRSRGRWDEAVGAARWSRDADGEAQDASAVASREVALAHAGAWQAAAAWLDSGELEDLRTAAERAEQQLAGVEREPFFALWLEMKTRVVEVELLLATAAGTPPLGHLRTLERLRDEALDHPQRGAGTEPALAVLGAWAQRLCGEDPAELASEAEAEAERLGLAGLACTARAIRGGDPGPYAPAGLIAAMLARRS